MRENRFNYVGILISVLIMIVVIYDLMRGNTSYNWTVNIILSVYLFFSSFLSIRKNR